MIGFTNSRGGGAAKLIPVKLSGASLIVALVPSAAWAADVSFTIQPRNGQAMIATVDTFLKCQMRRVDPWKPAVCPNWEILSTGTRPVLGQFCIQAQWGNQSFRGHLNMPPGARDRPYLISPQPPSEKGTCV